MTVTLVNPFITGIGGGLPSPGDGNTFGVTVTVASGTVSADLTAFPTHVRLSDMPAEFWSHVKADGGDIRVALGVDLIPCDLSRFDYASQDGLLWFRADLLTASDNEFQIRYGNSTLDLLAYDDPNGRNAVWADYAAVFLLGETPHNRAGGASARIVGDPDLFEQVATSPDINGHEGVTTDGTYFYVFDSQAIRKYTASWVLVATNSTIGAGAGNPGINELGGGTYANGKLYSASSVPGLGQHLAVWDADDLSFIEAFDVSDFASAAADYAYREDTGLLYTIRFGSGTQIIAIDPTDGSFQGSITLSTALASANGITYWHGAFWVAVDGNPDETYRVELDGTVRDSGMFGAHALTAWEGLHGHEDVIYQLEDPGSVERVRTYKPFDIPLGAGGGAEFRSNARVIGDLASMGVLGTQWTVGATIMPSDNVQRLAVALCQTGSAVAGNAIIGVDDGSKLGIWDSSNGWLYFSPNIDPALNVAHRVHMMYDGTTARHAFYNGGNQVTDATITARGASVAHLVMGASHESVAAVDDWRGKIGFVYARAGLLSADWVAAEVANLNAPETFSTLGAEEAL